MTRYFVCFIHNACFYNEIILSKMSYEELIIDYNKDDKVVLNVIKLKENVEK